MLVSSQGIRSTWEGDRDEKKGQERSEESPEEREVGFQDLFNKIRQYKTPRSNRGASFCV
jgi:hypothetical protein